MFVAVCLLLFVCLKFEKNSPSQIFKLTCVIRPYFPCAFINSYQLMRRCWTENPDTRPTFTELCQDLEDWMQREVPYLDMNQLDEDQPYYDASAVSLSSGSSCEGHAPGESLASNLNEDNLARN